jgi:hypothetical protein
MTRENSDGERLSTVGRGRNLDNAGDSLVRFRAGEERLGRDPASVPNIAAEKMAARLLPAGPELLAMADAPLPKDRAAAEKRAWSDLVKRQLELLCPNVIGESLAARRERDAFRAAVVRYFETKYDGGLAEPLSRGGANLRATSGGNAELEGLQKANLVMQLLRDLVNRDPPTGITRDYLRRNLVQNLTPEQSRRLAELLPMRERPAAGPRAVDELTRLHSIPFAGPGRVGRPRTDQEEALYRAFDRFREDDAASKRARDFYVARQLQHKRRNGSFLSEADDASLTRELRAQVEKEQNAKKD